MLDTAGPEGRVLVVHRPAYDDWSLPKGHVDPGEELLAAALREVLEETGVEAVMVAGLPTTEHDVAGARKRVHWFLMHPSDGAADPVGRPSDAEVDTVEWWPIATAITRLSYASERALLDTAVAR